MRASRRSVTGRVMLLLLGAIGAVLPAYSAYQSPSALVSQFANLFGADKYARLIWQRNAGTVGIPSSYETSGNNEIMKMDTRDGNAVVLVPTTKSGAKTDVAFTWDGNRIVYYTPAALEVRIVNWDGTNDRLVLKGYNGAGHCWRSPAGKDYVLATTVVGSPDQVNPRKLCRVNVDDTTDKVVILTTTWASTQAEEGNLGTHWVSTSLDGKYITGGFPGYSRIGGCALDASGQAIGAPKIFAQSQGCWPTMARDNTGDILMTVGEHVSADITTCNDNTKSSWNSPSAIGMYECLRWTPDRNFLTCIKCCGVNKPGPYVVRMSDKQFVYLNSHLTQVEGNMDVFFYTCTGGNCNVVSTTTPRASVNVRSATGADPALRLYDSRGRAVPGVQPGALAAVRLAGPERGVSMVVLRAVK